MIALLRNGIAILLRKGVILNFAPLLLLLLLTFSYDARQGTAYTQVVAAAFTEFLNFKNYIEAAADWFDAQNTSPKWPLIGGN